MDAKTFFLILAVVLTFFYMVIVGNADAYQIHTPPFKVYGKKLQDNSYVSGDLEYVPSTKNDEPVLVVGVLNVNGYLEKVVGNKIANNLWRVVGAWDVYEVGKN